MGNATCEVRDMAEMKSRAYPGNGLPFHEVVPRSVLIIEFMAMIKRRIICTGYVQIIRSE